MRHSILASLAFWLAVAGAIGTLLSPIGYRLGWFDHRVALLTVLKWAVIAAAAALIVSIVALYVTRPGRAVEGFGRALAAFVIGALVVIYPLVQFNKVRSLPRIHDISTDTDNPPQFVALAAARKAALNGGDYKGGEISAQQKQAYPDIAPLQSKLSPSGLFAKADAAARAAGWEIAAADEGQGRIEATYVSRLYGFKDDIVIRIGAAAEGSRLDVRSMSRVGQSDVGANAARIRAFMSALKSSGA